MNKIKLSSMYIIFFCMWVYIYSLNIHKVILMICLSMLNVLILDCIRIKIMKMRLHSYARKNNWKEYSVVSAKVRRNILFYIAMGIYTVNSISIVDITEGNIDMYAYVMIICYILFRFSIIKFNCTQVFVKDGWIILYEDKIDIGSIKKIQTGKRILGKQSIIIESNELYTVLIEEEKYCSFIESIRKLNSNVVIE